MEQHENYPGWKKGIYPAREDAQGAFDEGNLFVVEKDKKIVGTFVLRHKAEGAISIRLDVVKGNTPAEKLYQKNGYQFIGTVSLGHEKFGLPWFNLYEKILRALPIIKKPLMKTDRLMIKPFGSEDVDGLVDLLMNPDYMGHGNATEAVKKILLELGEMGFHKVTAGFFFRK